MKKYIENKLTEFPAERLNALEKKYPSIAGRHIRFIHNEVLLKHVRDLYDEVNTPKKSMLDLGSMYDFILPQVGDENDYRLAVDLIPRDKFQENSSKHFFRYKSEYICDDIEKFENECQFDIVICSEVAEHVLSPSNLFNKIYNCLSEQGRAIITFPNILFWKERLRFFLHGRFDMYKFETEPYEHTNIYTKENFRTLAELSGLRIEKRLPSFRVPYPKLDIVKIKENYSDWFDYGVIWVCKRG